MLRIGILGAAGIAPKAMIRPARRRDDLVVDAVASRRPGAAEEYARTHRIPRSFEDYQQLITDDEIDVVYVALPPSEHVRWSIAALEAGKHVLCEKPIAMRADEAAELADAARHTGLHAIEAFHDAYHPLARHLVELRDSGVLGKLSELTASFTADNPYRPGSIRHAPALGGGALMDLGCYPVHWIRMLLGTEPTVRSASCVLGPERADETIDADLSAGDVAIRLHASMAPGVTFAAPVTLQGANGSVTVDNVVLPHRGHSVTTMINDVAATYTIGGAETYDYQLDALVAAITDDTPAATEGDDFVATMTVIDDIYAAAGVDRRG